MTSTHTVPSHSISKGVAKLYRYARGQDQDGTAALTMMTTGAGAVAGASAGAGAGASAYTVGNSSVPANSCTLQHLPVRSVSTQLSLSPVPLPR